MFLNPTLIKEYVRKAFIGHTLDEVVEELKKQRVTKISLSGEGVPTSDGIDPTYQFYVHYRAETEKGKPIILKESADRTYSLNWRRDSNQRVDYRKEVLQEKFGPIEVVVNHLPETVRPYLDP